jgi:hypothetical protein
MRAGDDAHSVVDFAFDLGSAHVASRVMPSDTLPVDQSSANGVTLPTPNGNLLIATREMLPSESSLESLGRLHQQEHVPIVNVRGISLPSYQTLLYDTTQRTPTMLACRSILGPLHMPWPQKISLETREERFHGRRRADPG